MKAYYYFYDSYRKGIRPLFYKDHREAAGISEYNVYNREAIERFAATLSATLSKRVLSLKEGNNLKIHYLHSCGDLMMYRMTQEEMQDFEEFVKLSKETSELREEIREQTRELHDSLNAAERVKKKLKFSKVKVDNFI